MNIQQSLIDSYAVDMEILSNKYDLMVKMLDIQLLQSRIKLLEVSELYIYGGGYSGIQLYRSLKSLIHVLAIVDKSGALLLDNADIPVINLYDFQEKYVDQKVIITPMLYYQEIREELSSFVSDDKMIYIGEFLGGII